MEKIKSFFCSIALLIWFLGIVIRDSREDSKRDKGWFKALKLRGQNFEMSEMDFRVMLVLSKRRQRIICKPYLQKPTPLFLQFLLQNKDKDVLDTRLREYPREYYREHMQLKMYKDVYEQMSPDGWLMSEDDFRDLLSYNSQNLLDFFSFLSRKKYVLRYYLNPTMPDEGYNSWAASQNLAATRDDGYFSTDFGKETSDEEFLVLANEELSIEAKDFLFHNNSNLRTIYDRYVQDIAFGWHKYREKK